MSEPVPALRRPLRFAARTVAPTLGGRSRDQRICTPEIVRAMTSRWISEVPSKIV